MKNEVCYFALALITGALIPVQAATNSSFSKSVGHPLITGLTVFAVGLIGMTLFMLVTKTAMPTQKQLLAAPVSGYLGGIIVATYVVMITLLTPKLGVATSIGLIVTGQIICAVVIDHFGLFNADMRSITISRTMGLLLMIAGVYFVMKK
jgi:transporter family-2 protein